MPAAGRAHHVGITGVPGVGKSTAIEALGMKLIGQGHRVAVLAVDPSSTRTGDRFLATRPGCPAGNASRRLYPPVPDLRHAGRVAKATRETIVLLEAAAST
ncbi:argK family protein [Mycobacterium xenopi 3993]|nr:argK family protein [Mycobacterium xenopi 3993]